MSINDDAQLTLSVSLHSSLLTHNWSIWTPIEVLKFTNNLRWVFQTVIQLCIDRTNNKCAIPPSSSRTQDSSPKSKNAFITEVYASIEIWFGMSSSWPARRHKWPTLCIITLGCVPPLCQMTTQICTRATSMFCQLDYFQMEKVPKFPYAVTHLRACAAKQSPFCCPSLVSTIWM